MRTLSGTDIDLPGAEIQRRSCPSRDTSPWTCSPTARESYVTNFARRPSAEGDSDEDPDCPALPAGSDDSCRPRQMLLGRVPEDHHEARSLSLTFSTTPDCMNRTRQQSTAHSLPARGRRASGRPGRTEAAWSDDTPGAHPAFRSSWHAPKCPEGQSWDSDALNALLDPSARGCTAWTRTGCT